MANNSNHSNPNDHSSNNPSNPNDHSNPASHPPIQADEYATWRNLPSTRAFFAFIRDWRDGLKDTWVRGGFQHSDHMAYALADSYACARAQVYQELIELKHADIRNFYESEPTESQESIDE